MSDLEEGYIGNKFIADPKKVETGERTWNTLEVSVLRIINDSKEKIGSYTRNYDTLDGTFFPFVSNGKELALYSTQYMFTRVMELPSCEDLGGEDESNVEYNDHFCPVEFYVPMYRRLSLPKKDNEEKSGLWLAGDECIDKEFASDAFELGPIQYCDFGFVAGCAWGDETSMKIQFLDLSQADQGIIKRDARFGYMELHHEMKLKDAIDMSRWAPGISRIQITHTSTINYVTGEKQ